MTLPSLPSAESSVSSESGHGVTPVSRRRALYAGVAAAAALGGAGLAWWRLQPRAVQAGAEQADKVLRAYRLYLAGSALGFERGWMALHQMLAINPDGDTARGLLPGAQ